MNTTTYCGTPPLNSQGKDILAVDASFSTLRETNNSIGLFYTFANGLAYYTGTPDQPLQSLQWSETIQHAFPYNYPVDIRSRLPTDHVYIPNIYATAGQDPLIGFVHYEDVASCPPGSGDAVGNLPASCSSYHIGIAASSDRGRTWRYMGHVLNTYRNGGYGVTSDKTNIGGIPYIVKDGWFYVYYMEYPSSGSGYVSVARVAVTDLVHAAQTGLVSPPWTKYSNGSWTQSGLTGLGTPILPAPYTVVNIQGDAVYSTWTKKYYLAVGDPYFSPTNPVVMLLFSSTDGVNWGSPNSVAVGKNIYPTIVADSWIDDDFHSVGRSFSLIYPQLSPRSNDPTYLKCDKDASHYSCQDIYQTRVTLDGGNVSPILEVSDP